MRNLNKVCDDNKKLGDSKTLLVGRVFALVLLICLFFPIYSFAEPVIWDGPDGETTTLNIGMSQPPLGSLSGVVTDMSTGNALTLVSISTTTNSTWTNTDGTYTMWLAPGAYDITLSKAGYYAETINGVIIISGGTATLNVEMTPLEILSGVVTDKLTGNPLESVTVSCGSNMTQTNIDGTYSMRFAQGSYDITFSKAGYQTQTVNGVVITSGENATLNVEMTPLGTLSGLVTDTLTGNLIASVTVSAGGKTTSTASDGRYSMMLDPGTYDVTFSKAGYYPQTVNGVVITSGETTTLNIGMSQSPVVIWDGPYFTFTKANYADWTLPENQDRLTPDVWLTRQNEQGIFNIKMEFGYYSTSCPADTEWAFLGLNGNSTDPADIRAANYASLSFAPWLQALEGEGRAGIYIVNRPAVAHLINENIYFNITFTSWTRGGNGGGFTYVRSTNSSVDNTAPSVTITSTASDPTKVSPIPVTVTFSEPVTGFVGEDVTVGNGAISGFSGSGTTYSFNVTPSSSGVVTIDVASDVAQDTAGNGNSAATRLTRTFDNIAPTLTMTQPSNGSNIFTKKYVIKGTANDGTGSGVQKVEVSTDGGITWNLATGTASWSYVWNIQGVGTYTIKSRATDNANNEETPSTGITVTVVNRQPTPVTVNGKQLLVNGSAFTIKGVGYSPVPIGDDPEITPPYGDYFISNYGSIYERDLPLLRDMGANTVRLWSWNNIGDHLDFLDKAYNSGVEPIYVIAGFWINADLDIDPDSQDNVREQLKADFREMVAIHKDHPAILMWAIGNELNTPLMYGNKLDDLFSLINEMAAEAHAEEGANYHPVTTSLFDNDLITTISTYNSMLPSLDVWSANVYRGNTFGSLFSDYEVVSQKPLVILEFGIDAYDNVKGKEYEIKGRPYQAQYAENLWSEIIANSDVCAGGSIMEYSDEWWKGKFSTDTGCPDNNPSSHSTCGYATTSEPDGYCNEEWLGIMRIVNNGTNPDIMEPRAAYYRLQSLWLPVPAISINPVSKDFGIVNVGSASVPQTFTISNTGTANLSIGTITSTNPVEFKVQNDNCSAHIVSPSGTCTIQVMFSPASSGSKTANLSIPSNDPYTNPLNVSLNGTGISLPDLTGMWSNISKLSPTKRGQYTVSGNLTISNIGTAVAKAVVVNIYLSNDNIFDAGDMLMQSSTYKTVEPGIQKLIGVSYKSSTNPGGKYLIGVIDPSKTVNESNENNNISNAVIP